MQSRRKIINHRISCIQCDKTFSKMEHLNRHRLAHTGERPFKCSICAKRFGRRDVLLRHQRNHGAEMHPENLPHLTPPFGQFVPTSHHRPCEVEDQNITGQEAQDEPGTQSLNTPSILSLESREAYNFNYSSQAFGEDLNIAFLNMLFDSPLEQSTILGRLSPSARPLQQNEPITLNSLKPHPFTEDRLTPHSDTSGKLSNKVQQFWPNRPKSTARPHFWQEIAFASLVNVFENSELATGVTSDHEVHCDTDASDLNIKPEVKNRLLDMKQDIITCGCCNLINDNVTCGQRYLCVNTTDVFDQGLYLYLHKFQPTYPFLHLPTLTLESVSTLLLFVMSMIGISFLKTEEAGAFIRRTYPGIINAVYIQFISALSGSQSPADMLGPLLLAHHMLFIFISTGGNLCLEKSQLLYQHTLLAAHQYGYFSAHIDQSFDSMFSSLIEEHLRWRAWSRVEATKNLIIGLLLHDSWLAGLFYTNPIISTDLIILCLPCEDRLYQASTASEWTRLLTESISTDTQILEITSHGFHLPTLQSPIHVFSMYGILCSILLRVISDSHRLVCSSDLVPADQHRYVPWNIYRLDKRARVAAPLLVHLIRAYDQTLRNSNPNCIVIWHSACILLTVDINVLERATGRDGPRSMSECRSSLTTWVQTSAARRACLHAAQTFRALLHRKPVNGTAFQSVRALFISALVLSLYILTTSPHSTTDDTSQCDPFDLSGADFDWKVVGDEGISDSDKAIMALSETSNSEHPAVNFIRFGGPIVFNGKTYRPGARYAQRMILEFASLLDEVSTHWMADYARLLYMVHDTMVGHDSV